MANNTDKVTNKSLATHLIAGGFAGLSEALICHPLDTIKKSSGSFISVGLRIVKREGALSLYKGLGAVVSGIVPKMAIRFSSFEYYKKLLANKETAGLGAGVTEAVVVVTPMEVIKIQLQAQRHSMMDPMDVPKYRNAAHCAYTLVKEEGVSSLYKGVALTALRQATNQAVNFTVYQEMKKYMLQKQPDLEELPSYQHLILGGLSGAMGPISNAPIDTIKTRIQRSSNPNKESGFTRFKNVTTHIMHNEGPKAFYKGLTPRLLRVAPGQAITFMVYEKAKNWLEAFKEMVKDEYRSWDN